MRRLTGGANTRDKGCILCYHGSKHRYLEEIYNALPSEKGLKVLDLFAGGGSLITHLPDDYTLIGNDSERRVIDIHKTLQGLLSTYTPYIAEGKVNVFCRTHINSRKDNIGYYNLKKAYNEGRSRDSLSLLALTMGSNSNMIRFNHKGEQNLQFGKRYYNDNSQKKMKAYLSRVAVRDLTWVSEDFRHAFELYGGCSDVTVLDPPYNYSGKSTATYNEQGKWVFNDMVDVMQICDTIHKSGKKFITFNESVTKGKPNTVFSTWMNKYNVTELRDTLSGCNYQRKEERSLEVMVTNY